MSDYLENVAEFEEAIRRSSEGFFVLKLYISGSSVRSTRAISNLRAICEHHLPNRHRLEIIDVFQQPELARKEQLVAAPTLVKELPEPSRRLVGDLSDEDRVLHTLNIVAI